jgi:hypothetical protein
MFQTTFRVCRAVAIGTAVLAVPAQGLGGESSPESQRVVWGGPETIARNLDDLVGGNSVAATGVVMSTSTHMGEGREASIVFTSCVFQVDRWIPESRSTDSSITVDFVGGVYRGPYGRTRELRLYDRLNGHPEWIMESPRVGQRLLLFVKRVETSLYVLGQVQPRWQLLEIWHSSFELTSAGRVKPRGPNQGINTQVLDKDVESFIKDVEAAFKRRAKMARPGTRAYRDCLPDPDSQPDPDDE